MRTGLAALALGMLAAASSAPGASDPSEAAFKVRDQALLDAVGTGNRKAWDASLSSDALYIDENGEVITRADLIAQLDPLPTGITGSLKIVEYRLIRRGETVTSVYRSAEAVFYHDQPLNGQYLTSETWRREDGAWKLALVHVTAVNRDPPAVALSEADLAQYAGRYRAAPDLALTIALDQGQLTASTDGRKPRALAAELRDVLFTPGRPRSRKIFERDAGGAVTGFRDRREGSDIVWRKES
jgi:Domain of unknown function (DUF4440)